MQFVEILIQTILSLLVDLFSLNTWLWGLLLFGLILKLYKYWEECPAEVVNIPYYFLICCLRELLLIEFFHRKIVDRDEYSDDYQWIPISIKILACFYSFSSRCNNDSNEIYLPFTLCMFIPFFEFIVENTYFKLFCIFVIAGISVIIYLKFGLKEKSMLVEICLLFVEKLAILIIPQFLNASEQLNIIMVFLFEFLLLTECNRLIIKAVKLAE